MPETETELETAEWWNRKVKQIAALTQDVYDESLQRGIAKECARAVLPEGLVPTRMYFHGSLRTWMHYVGERTKAGVQKEHRFIAQECEKVLTEHFPNSMIAFRNLNA
jgi:thymidylate synthase (FAD)